MIITFKQIAIAVVLVVCGVSMSGVMAQQPPTLRVIRYQGDMMTLLAELPQTYGVTVGVEVDSQPFHLINISLVDATLPDVMNAIVQSSKKYQWAAADGFVDICPLAGCNPLFETRINNFNVKDLSPSEAFDQLFNLPEVQANMKAMKLKRRVPDNFPEKMNNSRFSVNLEGVSLRQALSKIARESGIQIWVFRNYPSGFFSISTVER